jgi:hypothetical protein
MVQKVVTLNRRITKNAGDLSSGPAQYFPDYANAPQAELTNWNHKTIGERKKWLEKVSAADLVIVGGGGLLEWDKYQPSFDVIRFLNKKAVIWGAGQNYDTLETWADIKRPYVRDYSHFKLVGIRDYGFEHEYIPDASCLSPLFDKYRKKKPKKEFAFQANRGTAAHTRFMPAGVPDSDIIGNTFIEMEQILDHFSAAETIVTSSFHGAYWGLLLNRKVIALAMSSKIYSMKYPVPIAHGSDWQRFIPVARAYPEALEESRSINRAFAERVFNL